jgi:CheY-like chemotaxis protein
VLDDEAPMRELFASNLNASGYIVQLAANGPAGLKPIGERQINLLLLDINLPGPNPT